VTAAWVGPDLALPASRALAAPWGNALHPVPAPLPERPWSLELRALLDEVPRRTAAQWRAATAREVRAPGWSGAMHEAARCAWAAGRLTDVARAQLVAARALVLAHTGVSPYAAARVLTAAVQAVCTRDLLPAEAHAVLVGPWEAGRAAG
jgi:hypothetical protein